MILSELAKTYERLVRSGVIEFPHLMKKDVHLVCVLDVDGNLLSIDVVYEKVKSGNTSFYKGKTHWGPHGASSRSGNNAKPHLFVDRIDYALGIPFGPDRNEPQSIANAGRARARFADRMDGLPQEVRTDPGVAATIAFCRRPVLDDLSGYPKLRTLVESSGGTVAFRLDDDVDENGEFRLVSERPTVVRYLEASFFGEDPDAGPAAVCSVYGELLPVKKIHQFVNGVVDADNKPGPMKLVSCDKQAFESYGLEKGMVSGVSVKAAAAYTGALNWLIGNGRSHALQGTTYVCWVRDSDVEEISDSFSMVVGNPPPNPLSVLGVLKSVRDGRRPGMDGVRVNILGLSRVQNRGIVKCWTEADAYEFADSIVSHFDDLGDVKPLWMLMKSIVREKETLPPGLSEAYVLSILNGRPYPDAIALRAMDRFIRSKSDEPFARNNDIARMALVGAHLARKERSMGKQRTIGMALDKTNRDEAYLLGRLFSAYESLQRVASDKKVETGQPTQTASVVPGEAGQPTQGGAAPVKQGGVAPVKQGGFIRNTMLSAALRAPATIFVKLDEKARHHLIKVARNEKNIGRAVNCSKLIDEVWADLDGASVPKRLSIDEKYRFLLGYHHQSNYVPPGKDKSSTSSVAASALAEGASIASVTTPQETTP